METKVKKQVLLKPIISEKALNSYRLNKVCTFSVSRDSTKADIMYYFKEAYNIDPMSVRTVVSRDEVISRKRKSFNTFTKRKYVKKAYISIGDNTFDIYENIK